MAPHSNILHLFSKSETQYTANLFEVIKHIQLDNLEKYFNLSTFAYKSLNNRTKIFTVIGDLSSKPEDLEISFQKKLRTRVFDTIAFVVSFVLYFDINAINILYFFRIIYRYYVQKNVYGEEQLCLAL